MSREELIARASFRLAPVYPISDTPPDHDGLLIHELLAILRSDEEAMREALHVLVSAPLESPTAAFLSTHNTAITKLTEALK